jgi:dienelactone hydrolase
MEDERAPIRVDEAGIEGELHLPRERNASVCVMLLGGSSGGLTQRKVASALADAGLAALELAYFNHGSLPERLHRIPLEYFARAAEWMVRECRPRSRRIVALGGSRGGELALELGATYPVFEAVVATSPSHVRWGAVGGGGAAWTLEGEDLPFVQPRPGSPGTSRYETLDDVIYAVNRPDFLRHLEGNPSLAAAEIAVERIGGPVLLFSGTDDALWPSDVFADAIELRARKHGFAHELQSIKYPDVGHVFPHPGDEPVLRTRFANSRFGLSFGGERAAIAQAAIDRWARILAFLADLPGPSRGAITPAR